MAKIKSIYYTYLLGGARSLGLRGKLDFARGTLREDELLMISTMSDGTVHQREVGRSHLDLILLESILGVVLIGLS